MSIRRSHNRGEETMKALKVIAVAVSLLVAGSAFSQTSTPVVDARQDNQKARINQGVKSGELTRREAAKLRAEQRAIRAEETREEEAQRRVVAERLRIARELHDVVAHHIAVVHVQAGVADHLLDTKPAEAHEAIAHIRRASGSVLDELGGLLDVLRQPDEPITPTAPAPGLGGLTSLIDSFSASGLAVDVRANGVPEPMPPAVELVAYRLVQEGLTNAHKHGSGTATLDFTFEPGALAIDIANPCPEGTSPHGGGHGLAGMHERAKAVGGTVTTSIDDDAWRLAARLPFEPAV
jgi:signal transduction histidine kinase